MDLHELVSMRHVAVSEINRRRVVDERNDARRRIKERIAGPQERVFKSINVHPFARKLDEHHTRSVLGELSASLGKSVRDGLFAEGRGLNLTLGVRAYHELAEFDLKVVVAPLDVLGLYELERPIVDVNHAGDIEFAKGWLQVPLAHSIQARIKPLDVLKVEQQFAQVHELETTLVSELLLAFDIKTKIARP